MVLIGGLAGCGLDKQVVPQPSVRQVEWSNPGTSAAPAIEAPNLQQPGLPASAVTFLPLRRGYYVASDTACSAASNATVSLLQRGGIGGSRHFCEFRKIEQIGPRTYRVLESCRPFEDGAVQESYVVTYTLSGDASFTSQRVDGWIYSARLCTQATMPAAWRHNDIRETVR